MSASAVPLWKQVLRQNFTDFTKLADFLELSELQRQAMVARPRFTLNLPMRLAKKIAKGTLDDPLLKQFLPSILENSIDSSFVADPVGDQLCRKSSKLIHKYQGRALLVCTSACAMHCRYCFRQHFDYNITNKIFEEELLLIAADTSINEVILSGGDPLSLDNKILSELLQSLASIPHIRKVRFHTRFPIGIPERIDTPFLDMLKSVPLQFWFVIHCNHANELDADIFSALKSIQKLGIPVLNMSVLLKDVNDSVEALKELCTALVDHGVFPYYLNQLDRVQGAAHFEVPEARGIEIMQKLATELPGYGLPRYIKEISGKTGKTIIV
ncbi:MAG: KamA family radical SAM protein [Parachlamydiaceae bacterium]|nr:KamA family radical SAM protein [Parachlamydiaceae bacterium]